MKINRKVGRSWIPNIFSITYLSSEPSPRLISLCVDSKLIHGPKPGDDSFSLP